MSTAPATRPNDRRLSLGEYTADIVISKREENCCYYVLQRLGSAEIIDMQRFETPEDAEAAAYVALKSWNGEDLLRQLHRLTTPQIVKGQTVVFSGLAFSQVQRSKPEVSWPRAVKARRRFFA